MIRAATVDDCDVLTDLRLAFLADVRGVSPASFDAAFVAATAEFVRGTLGDSMYAWLYEVEGRGIATVAVLVNPVPPRPDQPRRHDGFIINVYVVPAHRGSGVARALLDVCLASADALDIGRFHLKATPAGRPLYDTLGFVENADWLELLVT